MQMKTSLNAFTMHFTPAVFPSITMFQVMTLLVDIPQSTGVSSADNFTALIIKTLANVTVTFINVRAVRLGYRFAISTRVQTCVDAVFLKFVRNCWQSCEN